MVLVLPEYEVGARIEVPGESLQVIRSWGRDCVGCWCKEGERCSHRRVMWTGACIGTMRRDGMWVKFVLAGTADGGIPTRERGLVVRLDGGWVKVKEREAGHSCNGCVLEATCVEEDSKKDYLGYCSEVYRTDGREVVFVPCDADGKEVVR